MTTITNWAGNLAFDPARFAEPAELEGPDGLRRVLADSAEIRVLGTRHCFNDIADTTGTLVSLRRMPDEFRIDVERRVVRVAGHLSYGQVGRRLQERGYALGNLASLPHISIAGAIATGTHGSGDRNRSLAAGVAALEMMTADGERIELRRGDDEFAGAVVSLGALGVTTAVELDIVPTFDIRQTVFEGPRWDDVLADLDAVTSLGYSVSLFTTWRSSERVDQIWVKRRSDEPAPDAVLAGVGAVPAVGARHPLPGVDATFCTEQGDVPGPWVDRLPHFRLEFTPSNGAELQSEYLVDRGDAVVAIEALRTMAAQIAPLLQVCEVRTVAADDLWLSPASGRDVVGLHFTWIPDQSAVEAYLPTLEAALPSGARPHWGKLYARRDLASLYPRWDDAIALRDRLDPEHRFTNEHLRRIGW